MCGATEGGLSLDGIDVAKEAIIQGQVVRGSDPVGNAYVRLLDRSGEFTAEVPTSATGHFRFFAGPGTGPCARWRPVRSRSTRRVSAPRSAPTASDEARAVAPCSESSIPRALVPAAASRPRRGEPARGLLPWGDPAQPLRGLLALRAAAAALAGLDRVWVRGQHFWSRSCRGWCFPVGTRAAPMSSPTRRRSARRSTRVGS